MLGYEARTEHLWLKCHPHPISNTPAAELLTSRDWPGRSWWKLNKLGWTWIILFLSLLVLSGLKSWTVAEFSGSAMLLRECTSLCLPMDVWPWWHKSPNMLTSQSPSSALNRHKYIYITVPSCTFAFCPPKVFITIIFATFWIFLWMKLHT